MNRYHLSNDLVTSDVDRDRGLDAMWSQRKHMRQLQVLNTIKLKDDTHPVDRKTAV